MITSPLRKTMIAASLIVACGGIGMGQAFAHGPAAAVAQADTRASAKISDAWITTKVKSEFAATKGVSATDISVDTDNGVVTLSGDVGSMAEKNLAEQTARSVKGVTAVSASGLRVVGAATDNVGNTVGNAASKVGNTLGNAASDVGDAVSDTWISTKVKSEFATTDGVSATDIAVDTKDGKVMLSGTVSSNAEIERARQVAMGVKGVKSVDTSGLTVSGGQ
ncbi:MAG TPA: BON domain-containing protein [Rhodanobacteraceae bacterium]|jgi:hyperosmotically inducible protein|nr:BON domain-containing protein [Rhodanobacteraceae bacterium]